MLYVIFCLSLLFLFFFIWYLASSDGLKKRWVGVATILSLLLVCGVSLFEYVPGDGLEKGGWKVHIKPGLDIMGGTQFLLELGGDPTPAVRDQAVSVIRKRVDGMGLAEPVIQPSGNKRIIVQIPGVSESDKQLYRNQLERVAKLEFKKVHPESEQMLAKIARGEETIPFDYEKLPLVDRDERGEKVYSDLLVKRHSEMSGKYVKAAFRNVDQLGRPVVIIRFNMEGEKLFGNLTKELVGKRLAIVLDGEVYSAPVVRQEIHGSCEISGGSMTPVEAEELASVLENPLETPVKIRDERGVDPSLGRTSVRSGFFAGVIGLLAVVVFMIFYYHVAGIFSCIALAFNMFILLGLLAQFGFTLTMPGVAAMVLTIGMAVDASVLIFERIREEQANGKSLDVAVSAGFDKAFSSIFDANVTTIIAAAILFWQGSGPIQGFAIVLCLGVLSSMFSALVITRNGFDWLLAKGRLTKLSMCQILKGAHFDFLGKAWLGATVSVILLVIGIFGWIERGNSVYGVDFSGGDLLTLSYEERVPDTEIRKAAEGNQVVVQYQEGSMGDDKVLSIKAPFGKAEEIQKRLTEMYPQAKFERLSLDRVEGMIGSELKMQALYALLLGTLGIFIYTMWRFEMSFALGAIVALIHDVAIAVGIYVVLGHELSLPVIGAILSVAGYSINDTIVIFDRIREGLHGGYRGTMKEIMNESINLTLSRTLLTSGTTVLAVVALFIFGGVVIHDFALLLLLGIVVGTYSSIFIASPIAYIFSQERRKKA